MRYVLEGEWTGYTSSQRRVVHREVVSSKRAERLRSLSLIRYTDGTCLLINVREAGRGERVAPLLTYNDLIRRAEKIGGCVNVADLAP